MPNNKKLIETFYTAFKNKDYKTMQNCYSDNATFNDEVFVNLNAKQVRGMWEMLVKRGTDLELSFSNIQVSESIGSADWVASYTITVTKRKVVNKITANFIFENGQIVKHVDQFLFYNWAKQALGVVGLLFGRTAFLKTKVQKMAKKNLEDFIYKPLHEK